MTISEAPAPALSFDEQLTELVQAFRVMQLAHNRVIIHQSESLAMNPTDIRALFFISEMGEGATPKLVAEFLELSTGATTSLVDRMVGAGTIEREAHPTDRRSVVLTLTPAGRSAVRSVSDIYRTAIATSVAAGERDDVRALFLRIGGALAVGGGYPAA